MEVIPDNILVTTTGSIEGYKIQQYLGLVECSVYGKWKDKEFDDQWKRAGGELLQKAKALYGNAVVGVQIMSVSQGLVTILMGTAVKVVSVV